MVYEDWFIGGSLWWVFLFVAPLYYEIDGVLMIVQKILFTVRVSGCLLCDISGVSVDRVSNCYVLTRW